MVGRNLGHYRILEQLGRGGVGEVYRAEDTVLKRQVALKVLREPLAQRPDQLERFQHEAETLAALDHPNIVSIHSVEEAEGIHFITMQLIEGRVLSDLVPAEGMPLRDVAGIGVDLAAALAAAHSKGVIHRDLKPRNIMVTPEDGVKVLDFGLAKLHALVDDTVSSEGTTETLSDQGRLIGTIHYMSPEQAKGESVDPRSDIFALGVVLYELCTGVRPFEGDSKVGVLSAILSATPPPVWKLRSEQPFRLGRIIQRALSKDPEKRQETAEQIRDQLQQVENEFSAHESHSSGTISQILQGASWITVTRTQVVVAAVVLTIAIGVAMFAFRRAQRAGTGEIRVAHQEALLTWSSREEGGAISPSGEMWAFTSSRGGAPQIWLGSSDSGAPRPIRSGADSYKNLVWSPDERRIAFLQDVAGVVSLEMVSLWGADVGQPHLFEESLFDIGLVDWKGDHLYLYLKDGSKAALWRLQLTPGQLERVTDPRVGKTFHAPDEIVHIDISDDEKKLVFVVLEEDATDLWVSDLEGLDAQKLTDSPWRVISPRWVGASGRRIVYLSNESGQFDIWLIDGEDGARRPLTSSPLEERSLSLSSDGTVLIADTVQERSNLWLLRAGDRSVPLQVTNDSRSDIWPSVARDSNRFIFHRSRSALESGFSPFETEIFLASVTPSGAGGATPIVDDGFGGKLNGDASWVAFLRHKVVDSALRVELWIQQTERGRAPTLISRTFAVSSFEIATWAWLWNNLCWDPEGRALYFVEHNAAGSDCIVRASVAGEDTAQLEVLLCATDAPRSFGDVRPSPSGDRLAWVEKAREFGGGGKISVLDLASGKSSATIAEFGKGFDIFVKGWRSDGSLLVLRSQEETSVITAYAVHPSRGEGPQLLGQLEGSRAADIVLVPGADDTLLVTRVKELWGIFSWSPGSDGLQPVVENRVPGITFTGFGRAPNGTLLFAKKEDVRDIWRLRLEALD